MTSNFSRSQSYSPRILTWAALTALVGGLFGLVTLDLPLLGALYSELPPPLLGQPFGYQTIQNCNAGQFSVCPPNVQNNLGIAAIDFMICFGIAFLLSLAVMRTLRSFSRSPKLWKRNAIPAILLIFALLNVSLAGLGSATSGASLTQSHWQTPSGVEVIPENMTLFSGSASSSSSQGTAHMNLLLLNYHWTDLNVSLSASISGPNITEPVNIYQCSSPNSCIVTTSIMIPPYSTLGLNSTTTALYFGSQIRKGGNYYFQINITGESMSTQGNFTAL